jgi:AmmeMemoRadiSam system protein A
MSPLPSDARRALVRLAREAVAEAVLHKRILEAAAPAGELAVPAGAFVTLRREGRLRGCVGRIEPVDPLAAVVAYCAHAAALEDRRFPPVAAEELSALEIEVSVLSPLRPAAPHEVEIGRHGVRIRQGAVQGVLLPEVPVRFGWDRERFLAEACAKAGLEPEAWRAPETLLEVFTTEVITDTGSAAGQATRHGAA